jgi:Domain of unknown function (DUF6916)
MCDQKPFSMDTFVPRVGETFSIYIDEASPLEAELVSVEAYKEGGSQYSIVFRGPPAPVLPQRTYRIQHPALGRLDLFIVPVGPDHAGMRYEAVFS